MIDICLWKQVADTLYDTLEPLYGAIMYEDEVPGLLELQTTELMLKRTWLYFGPDLAKYIEIRRIERMYQKEMLSNHGIFVASSPWPSQDGFRQRERDNELQTLVRSLFRQNQSQMTDKKSQQMVIG